MKGVDNGQAGLSVVTPVGKVKLPVTGIVLQSVLREGKHGTVMETLAALHLIVSLFIIPDSLL